MIDWQRPERTEKWLRDWLRRHVEGRQITWIEPASGSTVGASDALVHMTRDDLCGSGKAVGGLLFPVELKKGYAGRGEGGVRIKAVVRPLQIRWHQQCREAGIRSAIVVVSTLDRLDLVYLFPGYLGKSLQSAQGESISRGRNITGGRNALAMCLTNNDFWA